jgi:GTPase Era involved in 16S rRNA processing
MGLLQPFLIPQWKEEVVTIVFVTNFPTIERQHNFVMEMVDKLIKATHFIRVKKIDKESNNENILYEENFLNTWCA